MPTTIEQQNQITDTNNRNKNSNNNNINIYVSNVVCTFSAKCHLNLRRIALEGLNVEYRKEHNMVNMRLKNPQVTANIWSSGKITCTGASSETDAYKAARRVCRQLQRLKFKVKLSNYRVVNVLATCAMPFQIDIMSLSQQYHKECSYEPELHPGATFKIKDTKATLKLYTTGSITLTTPSVGAAQKAVNHIYSIAYEFRRGKEKEQKEEKELCNPLPTDLNNNVEEEPPLVKKEEVKKNEIVETIRIIDLPTYAYEFDTETLNLINTYGTDNSSNFNPPSSTTCLTNTNYVLDYDETSNPFTPYDEISSSEYLFANTDTMMSATSYNNSLNHNNHVNLLDNGANIFGSSQSWLNDNLLVDNGLFDDFLP
jgi:TATA-box binding protein (TBP) (component of TFIID and TFIIIB)